MKFQIFKLGFFDVAPHLLSVVPFGIIFGAIGIELGFDPIMTYATSLIIFGGASQIVFLQLLSGGASSLIAITSVGVINSRHLLYGAVLSEYLQKLSLIKKLFISYFIVDQGFAVSNQYFKKKPNEKFKHYHLIGSGITLWFIWQVSTIMGNDKKNSVVDSNLKVHGSNNLYVVGSSVFPTGGHANPTFTIIQLTLRLKKHFSKNFII